MDEAVSSATRCVQESNITSKTALCRRKLNAFVLFAHSVPKGRNTVVLERLLAHMQDAVAIVLRRTPFAAGD